MSAKLVTLEGEYSQEVMDFCGELGIDPQDFPLLAGDDTAGHKEFLHRYPELGVVPLVLSAAAAKKVYDFGKKTGIGKKAAKLIKSISFKRKKKKKSAPVPQSKLVTLPIQKQTTAASKSAIPLIIGGAALLLGLTILRR